jgi:hypothetical protein
MSEYRITGETLMGIADAIRAKRGYSGAIPVPSFAGEIASIQAGGGTCTEPHVIEVDELPDAEAVEYNAVYLCGGRYYKYTSATLERVCVYMFGQWVDYMELMIGLGLPPENVSYNVIPTKNTSGLLESDGTNSFHIYYIEDEDNLFIYEEGQFFAIEDMPNNSTTYGGVISDISEATDTSKYYAVLSQGGWKEWIPKEECGGGAELNIAYGDTPPEDTTKLWCKCDEPSGVIVSYNTETVQGSGGTQTLSSIKSGRQLGGAAYTVYGNKIYILGGNGYPYDQICCYDTETNTTITLPTTLPMGTYEAGYATVGNKVYLFCGGDGSKYRNTIYCFDVETETAITLDTVFPKLSSSAHAVAVGTMIYLLGGSNFPNQMFRFDTETETVEELETTLPIGIYYSQISVVGNKAYLFGGCKSGGNSDTILCFDLVTLSVTQLSVTLPQPMWHIGPSALGTNIYLFGGNSGGSYSGSADTYHNTILCFDTITETIKELPFTLEYPSYIWFSATVGDKIYSFGQHRDRSGYTYSAIYSFSEETPSVLDGVVQILPSVKDNIFPIINTDAIRMEIGVNKVYKGNAENVGEYVETAIYKDGTWTNI